MTLMIEIKPELEAELAAQAQAHGMNLQQYASRVLEKAAARSSEPGGIQAPKSKAEIRAWLSFMAEYSNDIPPMPGQTFSREMIYEEHA